MDNALSSQSQALKICVVGAGAAGLAVLKVIKDSHQFKAGLWTVDAYEDRDDIGGVWLPAPPTSDPPLTPLHDSVVANLPHPVMCYSSFWFPPSTPLFPKASVIEEYLRTYAKEFNLRPHIRLNTAVTSTRWTGTCWKVSTSAKEEHEYDRLVVASGHFRVPYYPPLPGLDSWRAAKRAIHSAWYRAPSYVGDKVLIVGGGPSGTDIAAEMCSMCTELVLAAPGATTGGGGNITVHGRAVRFSDLTSDTADSPHTVYFEDGSSETDIDYVFLATGFLYSFPFFTDLQNTPPPPVPPLPAHLHNSTQHLFPLALGLFPLQDDFPPTAVAFVGLPVLVPPLPLFEAQAQAIVRVFSEPTALDVAAEADAVLTRVMELRANPAIGDNPDALAHAWHRFRQHEHHIYRDALHVFAGLTGDEWKVPEWGIQAYEDKFKLKHAWDALVKAGEAEEWVKGVGEGGNHEWVDLMQRLLEREDGVVGQNI
ncbi:hypothetical protein M0805_002108 [Coniferiporia weirii]|nr:hypothetical protein M0805_002108 [Coniferiporia weirii]